MWWDLVVTLAKPKVLTVSADIKVIVPMNFNSDHSCKRKREAQIATSRNSKECKLGHFTSVHDPQLTRESSLLKVMALSKVTLTPAAKFLRWNNACRCRVSCAQFEDPRCQQRWCTDIINSLSTVYQQIINKLSTNYQQIIHKLSTNYQQLINSFSPFHRILKTYQQSSKLENNFFPRS